MRLSLQQIEAELKPESRSVPAPVPPPPAPARAQSRRRHTFPVTIATVIVLALFFGFSYFRGNKSGAKSAEPTPPATTAPPPAAPMPTPASPTAAKASTATAGSVRNQVLPEVPRSAKNTITGTVKVTVKAQVDPSGKVTSATFKSAGPSKYFAGLALNAAERWEFSPPETDGQAVPSTWLIQFRFKRGSTQASAQRANR